MSEKTGLLSAGARIARHNKRYVIWFFLLNLMLALLGSQAFSKQAGAILDHSLYADKLLRGFDVPVFAEMLARPEFGSSNTSTAPAFSFAFLFFLASLLLLPGVWLGYASSDRLPRSEFYRTCGHNIWRSVRLFLCFIILAAPTAGILGAAQNALVKAAGESSHERLPFFIHLAGAGIIFLVLTSIRVWFDLAQAQVVVADQGKVRKSIAAAYRGTRGHRMRLLGSYVLITLPAIVVLVVGIWVWIKFVPAASVLGAFVVGQAILLALLAARFWQRACAVAFYLENMTVVLLESQPVPVAPSPIVPIAEDADEGGLARLPQT